MREHNFLGIRWADGREGAPFGGMSLFNGTIVNAPELRLQGVRELREEAVPLSFWLNRTSSHALTLDVRVAARRTYFPVISTYLV